MHAALFHVVNATWNAGDPCEKKNDNYCMARLMNASKVKPRDLSGVLSVPAPGTKETTAAKTGQAAMRLQCTCNPPQCPDMAKKCTGMPTLFIHVGRPFFNNNWHWNSFRTYLEGVRDKPL